MAAFVGVLLRAMSQTPGGRDERKVPENNRLGSEADVGTRIELLIEETTYTLFEYVYIASKQKAKLLAAFLCLNMISSYHQPYFIYKTLQVVDSRVV